MKNTNEKSQDSSDILRKLYAPELAKKLFMTPGQKKKRIDYLSQICGKKAVRTTFKISKEVNDILLPQMKRGRFKLKDVIDGALADLVIPDDEITEAETWQYMKDAATSDTPQPSGSTVRKTVVIYKCSLDTLHTMSEKYSISRDAIVDTIIRSVSWLIIDERTYEREEYEAKLPIVSSAVSVLKEKQEEINSVMCNDISERFAKIVASAEKLQADMEKYLKDNLPTDPIDWAS